MALQMIGLIRTIVATIDVQMIIHTLSNDKYKVKIDFCMKLQMNMIILQTNAIISYLLLISLLLNPDAHTFNSYK